MASPKHLDWGKCEWFYPNPSTTRKCYQGSDNFTITMGLIQPNIEPGPHKHYYEQTVVILQGKCDFYVGEGDAKEKFTFDAKLEDGGICFMTIPPNEVHWIENPYDKPVYNMDIFAPKRTEDREESVEVK